MLSSELFGGKAHKEDFRARDVVQLPAEGQYESTFKVLCNTIRHTGSK